MQFEKRPEKKIWVVNKGEPIDHINLQLKKHIYLKTDIPLQFPMNISDLKLIAPFWKRL